MKIKDNTVGWMIFLAFSLALFAIFSIWWIGYRTPAYAKLINQYFELPRYFGESQPANRNLAESKSSLKLKIREIFTGQIRKDYLAAIDNTSLSRQSLRSIFPGLSGFSVKERRIRRKGARIIYTFVGKTKYHYDRDIFTPLSELASVYLVGNYNQEQIDHFSEPDQIQLHTREKRILHLISVEKKWYIAKIEIIPLETRLQPSPSDAFTGKTLSFLQDPEWRRLNNELTELCRQQQYVDALTVAQNAVAIADNLDTENYLGKGSAFNNLAVLYLSRNQLVEAAPLFQKSLSSLASFTNYSTNQDLIAKNILLALPFMLNQAIELQGVLWSPVDFKLAQIELGLHESRLRELLGDSEKDQPEKSSSAKEIKDDRYKEYVFPKVLLRLKKVDSGFKVWQVNGRSAEVVTIRGIKPGDSKQMVLWVYGKPEVEEPDKLEYRIELENNNAKYLRFNLDSDEKVSEIEAGFIEK